MTASLTDLPSHFMWASYEIMGVAAWCAKQLWDFDVDKRKEDAGDTAGRREVALQSIVMTPSPNMPAETLACISYQDINGASFSLTINTQELTYWETGTPDEFSIPEEYIEEMGREEDDEEDQEIVCPVCAGATASCDNCGGHGVVSLAKYLDSENYKAEGSIRGVAGEAIYCGVAATRSELMVDEKSQLMECVSCAAKVTDEDFDENHMSL